MNHYAERINNRRIEKNISLELLIGVMGWDNINYNTGRKRYYRQIASCTYLWHLEDICKILNLFECTYEELFRGYPFQNKVIYIYRLRPGITKKIRAMGDEKCIPLKQVHSILDITRQNYYLAMSNKKLRISQINALLEKFEIEFHELFSTRRLYKTIKEEERV
jgi:hypothetical protein